MSQALIDAATDGKLDPVNQHFAQFSYAEGYCATAKDLALLALIPGNFNAAKLAHVARWYYHISALPVALRARLPADAAAAAKAAASSSSSSASSASSSSASASSSSSSESEFNLSGSDSSSSSDSDDDKPKAKAAPVETESQRKTREEAEAKKKAYDEKIARNVAKEKSNVIFDIRPEDETSDLNQVFEVCKTMEKEGLVWGSTQRQPIAYGLEALRVCITIQNVLVSVEDLMEEIEKIPGVGSTQIVSFQKI